MKKELTVSENARKAVKARWKKTTKKQRKDISAMLHKAKKDKKLTEVKKKVKVYV